MRTVAIIPFSPSLSPVPTAPQGPCEPQTCDSTEGGGRKETVSKSQKYIKTAVTFPQHPPLPMSVAHHPSKKKTVRAGKRRCPGCRPGLGKSLQPGNGRQLTVFTGSPPPSTRGPLGGQRCRRVRQDAADGRALPQGQKTEEK
jgi:hypothetical protein